MDDKNKPVEDKKKTDQQTDQSFDLKNFNDLAGELLDVNKKLTAAQQVKRERFEKFLCKEFAENVGDSSDSDDDVDINVFTVEISSIETSPKAAPKSLAARPTDRKRSHLSADNDANNNEQPVKRVSPVPRKQRRSLEQTAPMHEAPSGPQVVRESLPAGTIFKSCPLPETCDSLAADEAKSCPRVNDEMPSTSKQQAINVPRDVHKSNSIEEGRSILEWIICPVKPEDFFSKFWEKNACLVLRKKPNFFSKLISFRMIDEMLIKNHLEFTTNIDVTSYTDGKRETLNPEGRANPPTVWGFYGDGCSIRILNPSTYLPELRNLCSMLQEFFPCLVDANVYLTPPNSQGFAPHFDDIEAFVLQIEGRKRWRLYMPLQPADVMSRESAGNYSQEQLGEPILDEVLEAGDFLYLPRGTIHQAVTEKDQHSLHITLSVYQQQAYANLMEHVMPHVLQRAVKQSLDVRSGLPLHTCQNLGFVHGSDQNRFRREFFKGFIEMVQKNLIPTEADIDWGVDQLAKKFQHEALPLTILPEERVHTDFGSRSDRDEKGYSICDYKLTDQTSIRLLRANILRLVSNEDSLRIYYYVDNALEYCKYEPNFMEIESGEAGVVETLIKTYPAYIKVPLLPLKSAAQKIKMVTALWERGLLMTEEAFK